MVSAIILMHAGVSDEDIIDNYVLSKEYGKERLDLVHQNFPGINMNIITPRDEFMRTFLTLFRKRFHKTERYFKEIGLSDAEIAAIAEKIQNSKGYSRTNLSLCLCKKSSPKK